MQRDFWIRVVDVRRIGWRWLCAALLLPPAFLSLAIVLDIVFGGALSLDAEQPQGLTAIVSLVFFVFWFGPLPEEIGWRGFALDRLQCRMSALTSSLLLGTIWALWHLPLFYIPGTYQYDLGLGTIRFWLFIVCFLPLSVLMTWIYNSTRRSTLSAVLVHFSWNLCAALLPKTERVAALEVLVVIGAALLITTVYGRAQLSR
jgi:membrane protease YdiL (CAAX protease family)